MQEDPIGQFAAWFEDARNAGLIEPHAMALATVGADGRPAVRMVLLKEFGSAGFDFYTSYESRKARDLQAHPWASLAIWWDRLHRQVRVEGPVARVAGEESDRYFATRPRGAQLGAWASPQSAVIAQREELEQRVGELRHRYAGSPVPRPAHWGGYRVHAETIEFWQGQPDRLHDRFRYRRLDGDRWAMERLAP